MGYMESYREWLENPYFDEETKAELKAIQNDEKEIRERFYADLEFGTGGLRGIIGAGINRMNKYSVAFFEQAFLLSRHMYSTVCVLRRSFPSRFVIMDARPASM